MNDNILNKELIYRGFSLVSIFLPDNLTLTFVTSSPNQPFEEVYYLNELQVKCGCGRKIPGSFYVVDRVGERLWFGNTPNIRERITKEFPSINIVKRNRVNHYLRDLLQLHECSCSQRQVEIDRLNEEIKAQEDAE